MIEEDLFFPGKAADESDDEGPDSSAEDDDPSEADGESTDARSSIEESDSSQHPLYSNDVARDSILESRGAGRSSSSDDKSNSKALPPTPPSTSPLSIQANANLEPEAQDDETSATLTKKNVAAASALAEKQNGHEPFLPPIPMPAMGTSSNGIPRPPSKSPLVTSPAKPPGSNKFAASTSSLIGSPIPTSLENGHAARGRVRGHSSVSTLLIPLQDSLRPMTAKSPSVASTSNVRTVPTAPSNPRDHSLLETVYNEMHARRFVNLAPLSLLANSLGLYFKGTDQFILVLTWLLLTMLFRPKNTSASATHLPTTYHAKAGTLRACPFG